MSLHKFSVVLASMCLFIPQLTVAAPDGGVVAAGIADISKSGNTTNINQTSPSAVINWHSFDTAGGEAVNFHQPDKNSVVLNRVNSGLPTNFAGTLTANGKVFIVNPAGMVFAQGSRINTAGFLATTLNIKDQDFMSGKYSFSAAPCHENASIINNGSIDGVATSRSRDGFLSLLGGSFSYDAGFVALIAPNVINGESGYISAAAGKVVLASGKAFVLDFNQDNLINFDVSSVIQNDHIENNGDIFSEGGKVFMTTNTASTVLDSMINTSGITEANGIRKKPGKNDNQIILESTDPKAGMITAGSITANKVILKADRGIIINKNLQDFYADGQAYVGRIPASEITAKTTAGDITLNAYLQSQKVSLHTDNGAITESNSSTIWARNLNTDSTLGTTLSGKNKIWNFTATNTTSGGIYLKNFGEPVATIGTTGGNYKLDTIGFWEYYFGGNG